MAFSVTDFKARGLPRGGYRPSLFEVQIPGRLGQEFNFLAQTSNVPAMTVEQIIVPYFGRQIKIAGNRTYAEWSTTVMVEEDFGVRDELERWSMAINQGDSNIREEFNEEYKEDAQVLLYSKNGTVVRRYNLVGLWPQEVGTIELTWDSTEIGTYEVTWAFDFMNEGS
jgi:hypothetical protein